MYSETLFVQTRINRNLCYLTQNFWEQISPNVFTPLIQKSRCLTLTQKFRNGYVKSTEKAAKPDYTSCYLVIY